MLLYDVAQEENLVNEILFFLKKMKLLLPDSNLIK